MAGRRKKGRAPTQPLDLAAIAEDAERFLSRARTAIDAGAMALGMGIEHAQKVANAASTIQDPRTHVDIACRALVRFCRKKKISKEFAVHALSRAFDFITDTSATPEEPSSGDPNAGST